MLRFKSHEEVKDFPVWVKDLVAPPFYTARTFDFFKDIVWQYHMDARKFLEQVNKAALSPLHIHSVKTAGTQKEVDTNWIPAEGVGDHPRGTALPPGAILHSIADAPGGGPPYALSVYSSFAGFGNVAFGTDPNRIYCEINYYRPDIGPNTYSQVLSNVDATSVASDFAALTTPAITPIVLRDEDIQYQLITPNFRSFASRNTNAKPEPGSEPARPEMPGSLNPAEVAQVDAWLASSQFAPDDVKVTLAAAIAKRDEFKAYFLILCDLGDKRAQIVGGVRYHDHGFNLSLFEGGNHIYGASLITTSRRDWREPILGTNPFGIIVDPQDGILQPFMFTYFGTSTKTGATDTPGLGLAAPPKVIVFSSNSAWTDWAGTAQSAILNRFYDHYSVKIDLT